MPRLIAAFLRHGDYEQLDNVPSALQPFSLSREGQEQAISGSELIASYCQKESLTMHSVVNSSTSLRAWQTASAITSALISNKASEKSQTLFVESHIDLCERSVGSVANLTINQIENILKIDPRYEMPKENWKSDSYYRLPFEGAESLMDSGQRVANHIQTYLSQLKPQIHQDTLKLFVGHGASFRHAAYHMKLLTFEKISQLSMFHAQPVFFEYHDNQSCQHIGGDWKIRKKKDRLMD